MYRSQTVDPLRGAVKALRKPKKKAIKQTNGGARFVTSGPPNPAERGPVVDLHNVNAPMTARVPPQAPPADTEIWLPAPKIRQRLGGISPVTFWRWRHNPKLGFPPGRCINGRWYFQLRLVSDWHAKQGEAGVISRDNPRLSSVSAAPSAR
jgi:hypothetical protein